MRFASAFIPTLLSASMVLADDHPYPYPYAGYRVHTHEERWFVSVTANAIMPVLYWNCYTDLEQLAFITSAIGNPLACGRGIEAGIQISCSKYGTAYATYYQLHPYDTHTLYAFPVTAGDEIHINVHLKFGFIYVFLENKTTGDSVMKEAGFFSDIEGCLTTAAWGMSASLMYGNLEIQPPPGFEEIKFKEISASDFYDAEYNLWGAEELVMRDTLGIPWITPMKDEDSFTTFSLM